MRLATRLDLEAFSHLAEQFYRSCAAPSTFDQASFLHHWGVLMDSGVGLVLLRAGEKEPAEAIGVIIHPDMNDATVTAVVTFWYFVEEPCSLAAGRLYEALEDVLQARGVKRLYVGALLNERFAKVIHSFMRRGYTPVQIQLVKEL